MTVSKAQMAANKKHDQAHFKYQSVKLKISEYEQLKKAVDISKEPMNAFLRSAIMQKVSNYVQESPAPEVPEPLPAPQSFEPSEADELTEEQAAEPIEVLNLSVRTYNVARRAGCTTIGELAAYIKADNCVIAPEDHIHAEIVQAIADYRHR